jgi:hypothetical protein
MKPTWTIAIAVALGACSSGLGQATRDDITARMMTAQQPIAACYATALQANRRLRGNMEVQVTTEPSTGRFANVVVSHDELRDPAIRQCVVTEVGKLALAKPTKSAVQFEYPLRFAPNK